MSKARGRKNPERALLIAGVLDDPRWEKLASGDATSTEVADLRAWARQSKAAKAVWDVFEPATSSEVDALAANVLRTLESRKPTPHDNRTLRLARSKGEARSSSSRMMTRHVPRRRANHVLAAMLIEPEPERCVRRGQTPEGTMHIEPDQHACGTLHFVAMAQPNIDSRRPDSPTKLDVLAGLAKFFRRRRVPNAPVHVDEVAPIRVDATGTTSSRIALSREAAEISYTGISATAGSSIFRGAREREARNSPKHFMMFATGFFLLGTLAFMGAVLVDKMAHDSRNVVHVATMPPSLSSVVPPAVKSAHVLNTPSQEPRELPKNVNVAATVQPMPSAFASASPVKPRESSKPKPVDSAKSAKKMIEVCNGVGVFQRCKKVPANWDF